MACRYEDLRADTAGTLIRLVNDLTGRKLSSTRAEAIAEAYSMANMRKRKINNVAQKSQTTEMSFMRKGAIGGWSNSFSDAALDWFETHAGDGLDLLGYARGRPKSKGVQL